MTGPDSTPPRLPSLYLPHGGGPCFFMDWEPPEMWKPMEAFLRGIAATLPARPRALLVVSGHWTPPDFTVNAAARPGLLFDYHGFPPHTYRLRYAAPGAPRLASRVRELLGGAGLPTEAEQARGLDHGVFIPLMLMFPEADIPVLQLSLRADLDPTAHLAAGAALAPLRDDGVLIVGSGMSFHNMRAFDDPRFGPVSAEFDDWLTRAVASPPTQRTIALQRWTQAPHARLCHPPRAEEHLIPLMVAAGAAPEGAGRRVFNGEVLGVRVSGYRFD